MNENMHLVVGTCGEHFARVTQNWHTPVHAAFAKNPTFSLSPNKGDAARISASPTVIPLGATSSFVQLREE
jgi:hypothetical protein